MFEVYHAQPSIDNCDIWSTGIWWKTHLVQSFVWYCFFLIFFNLQLIKQTLFRKHTSPSSVMPPVMVLIITTTRSPPVCSVLVMRKVASTPVRYQCDSVYLFTSLGFSYETFSLMHYFGVTNLVFFALTYFQTALSLRYLYLYELCV